MKMKAKLTIIALIPLFLSLIIMFAVFWAKRDMGASREIVRSADKIAGSAFELNQTMDQYLLYPSERPKIQFRSIHESIKRPLERIKTKTDEEQEIVKRMRQNHESIGPLFDRLVSIHEKLQAQNAVSEELREMVIGQLLELSRNIVSDAFQLSRMSEDRMDVLQGRVFPFILIIALISGVGLTAFSYLMARRIERANEDLQQEITERKKAEEALRDSEAKANALIKYAPTGIYEVDYRGPSFISVNDAMCQILGYTREELFSIGPSALLDGNGRALFADRIRRQLAGEKIEESVEYRVQKKDGSFINAILNVSLGVVGGRALVVAHDITERKRAEEALQQRTFELQRLTETLEEHVKERTGELANLSSQLVSAQENERRRVSYDLHDNAWQTLVAIRFEIESLFSGRDDWAALQSKSKTVMAAILDTVGKIRSMQGDLWPYVLDDIGILATIDWYCREFEKNHPDLTIEREDGLAENEIPRPAKIVIYRILQETLSNVAKHSQASRVILRLMKKDHRVEFSVGDDGIGFNPEETIAKRPSWGGWGLLNIKARAELSGGLFGVESVKGKGTTVRASWKIDD